MLTLKNTRPDTPGYCSYLSAVEFDLVLQDDELIAVFWYGKSDSSAVVAALLLNLDYTRVENKTTPNCAILFVQTWEKTATSLQTLKV
jgi:hypothetical protein